MSQLFLRILNLSLYAALLIPAVMLLRVLFHKAPKWVSCLFWALVAVRLLCPVTIESPFSLLPATEKLPTANYTMAESSAREETAESKVLTAAQTAAIMSETESADGQSEDAIAKQGSGSYDEASIADTEAVTDANPVAESISGRGSRAGKADLVGILAIIWLIGFCVMMGQALFSFLRLKHTVAASVQERRNLRVCDEIRYPFILGIIRPIIYLPGFLEGGMRRFVLAHERAHLNRHDHWWKPLGFFLLALHWFNPLCWIAYILFCRDLEMACDERVIRGMDRDSKADYSQTLLLLSSPASQITACPVAFGEIGVKERVKGIINYKKPAVWIVLLAIVGCIAVAVCFLTSPLKTETAVASQDEVAQDEIKQDQAISEQTEEQPTELVLADGKNGDDAVLGVQLPDDASVEAQVDMSQAQEPQADSEALLTTEAVTQAGDVVYKADIDGNGQEDYIYMHQLPDEEMTDEHAVDWTLVVNGKQVSQGSHALYCDFDTLSVDLDRDNQDEIVVRIMPHVNSMPLEEFTVLKQSGDDWVKLQNTTEFGQKDNNGDLSNAFPVSVTVGEKPATLDIQVAGEEKITIDVKKHYENMRETQAATNLHDMADGLLSGKYAAGDAFGTTADWGIWEIESASIEGIPCIRATQGIESIEGGKMDILGTMDIYFNYGQDGKIDILKTEFHQTED
ncbi:MAG: hypothetical protein IK078_08455 [Lachnospiraceae bacterium]|nr:hypothetical protein [Lachnospiraceae bacterium]